MFSIWYAIGFYPLSLFAIIFIIWLFTKKSIIFCENHNLYKGDDDGSILFFLKYIHHPDILKELIVDKPISFFVGFIASILALIVLLIISGIIIVILSLLGPIILIPIFIVIKTLLQVKKENKS